MTARFLPRNTRLLCFLLGPALGVAAAALPIPELSDSARAVLMVTVWTAFWWVTEALPIPVTSLLPALLMPLLGIADATTVARWYSHHLILLLLGGFFIARSIEVWGLHRRIALTVIGVVGSSPRRLVFGFICAAGFLSMWISNTATTLMLVPIALSVVARLGHSRSDGGVAGGAGFPCCLLLGIAYAANVGGVGTLIGTPPNLIYAAHAGSLASHATEVDFLTWFSVGLPVTVIFVPLIALLLVHLLVPVGAEGRSEGRAAIAEERRALGPMTAAERRVLVVFLCAAVLWITKGSSKMPGWSHLLAELGTFPREKLGSYVTDSVVAISMAMLLFVLPSGQRDGRPLLVWKDVETVPWGMLFLFGGGFAIAGGFKLSGLSDWCGNLVGDWTDLPSALLVGAVALLVSFLTELTSNTASTNILMPILSSAADGSGLHPLVLMTPAVLTVSFAFMLPVATAPNAIVFATGVIPIRRMMLAGFVLNLVGTLVVVAVMMLIAGPALGL